MEMYMSVGFWQILIILLLVMLIFGAGRLPKVMADLAKGLKAFKDGLNDDADEKSNKKIDKKQ